MIGIAGGKIMLGQAVEGEQQFFAAGNVLPVCSDALCECLDIAGVVMIVRDETKFRQPAPGLEDIGDGIKLWSYCWRSE